MGASKKSSGGFVIGGKSLWTVSVPNCGLIYEDLIFFLKESYLPQIDNAISSRYARIAIILLAFYIEAIANLLFDTVGTELNFTKKLNNIMKENQNMQKDDIGNRYPIPLQKFMIVYYALFEKNMPIEILGIQDLFMIRNKIISHPSARSIIAKTGYEKGLTEKGKAINYRKFTNFPNILREFAKENAMELYNEVRDFLSNYFDLLPQYFPNLFLCQYFYLKDFHEIH